MISNTNSKDPFSSHQYTLPSKKRLRLSAKQKDLPDSELPKPSGKHLDIRPDFLARYLIKRCLNCIEDPCFDAHVDEETRRVPKFEENEWNYKPVLCLFRMKCHNGHMCKFAHNETEVLFHPLIFKTQVCESAMDQYGICGWGGKFCPKAHLDPNFPGREPKDLHSLEDYGLKPVYLENTKQEQIEANRRAAKNSATYKASVKRMKPSEVSGESTWRTAKERPQAPPRRNPGNKSIPKSSSFQIPPGQSEAKKASASTCFNCKDAISVFKLQCSHSLCSACLDIESCPVCNP